MTGVVQAQFERLVGAHKTVTSTFQEGYELLVQAIIRPPRSTYEEAALGPKRFMFAGRIYHRQDLEIPSHRPDRCILKCSHFKPEPKQGQTPLKRPCVIFLHGNAASRLEGLCLIRTVLAASADLFLFDFGGSGMSQGEYVSLGHWEKEDLAAVVARLRETDSVSSIALWGRSMGAVTALLYAVRDVTIAGMVVDSPFTDLRTLAGELCEKETYGAVPTWLADAALSVIKVSIQQRVGFDLEELCPIDAASSTTIPALFAAATGDDFIYPHHCRAIQGEYGGSSRLASFDGDHNSDRPKPFLDNVRKFFMRTLHAPGKTDSATLWQFYDEKPVTKITLSREEEEALAEKRAEALAKIKRNKELLKVSAFGADDSQGVLEPPPPDPVEVRRREDARVRAEKAARERERREAEERERERRDFLAQERAAAELLERRRAARPLASGYPAADMDALGGHRPVAGHRPPVSPNNGHRPAAPSPGQGEIKKQLSALGFSNSQIEGAMKRSSTLEGCVEWILTSQ